MWLWLPEYAFLLSISRFQSVNLLKKCGRLIMQVRLTFDEPESGVTVVHLSHTDVPEEDRLV